MLKLWDGKGVTQNGDGIMVLQVAETFPNELQLLNFEAGRQDKLPWKGDPKGTLTEWLPEEQ